MTNSLTQRINRYLGSLLSRIREIIKSPSKKMGYIFTGITLVLVVAILGYLIYREREILFSFDWKINYIALGFSIVVYSLSMMLATFNWGNIMNHLAGKLSYRKHFRYFCIANAAKRLPGTIWYIASRANLYQQDGIDIKLTSIASALEYAFVTLSGIIGTLVFSFSILTEYRVSPWLLGALFILTLFLIQPKVINHIFRALKVEASTMKIKEMVFWTATYFLQWMIGGSLLFLVINIIYPLPVSALNYVLGIWLVVIMVSRMMIFLPSNFGVTEIGFSLLLSNLIPSPIAVVASLLFRLLVTAMDILFAFASASFRLEFLGPLTKKD